MAWLKITTKKGNEYYFNMQNISFIKLAEGRISLFEPGTESCSTFSGNEVENIEEMTENKVLEELLKKIRSKQA